MTPPGDAPDQPPALREPAHGTAADSPTVPVVIAVDGGESLVASIDAAWAEQDRTRSTLSMPSAVTSPLGRRR